MKKLKPDIVFCYEKNCGGETVATENIIKEFKANKKITISSFSLLPLTRDSFFYFVGWLIKSILRWLFIIKRYPPKKWIYVTTYTAGVAALILKSRFKYKICFHYHGSRIPPKTDRGLYGYHKLTQIIKHNLTYWLHRLFINNTDLIVVPSEFTKTEFLKEFPFTQTDAIKVIPNGIYTKIFKPVNNLTKNSIRKKLHFQPNLNIILYSGRIDKNKNILLILKSFKIIRKSRSGSILVIAYPRIVRDNELKYLTQLHNFVRKNRLEEKVKFIENSQNLAGLYQISNLVISLSAKENLPMSLLEALACKTIYAAYPAGQITDILNKIDSRLLINVLKPDYVAKKVDNLLNFSPTEKRKVLEKEYLIAQEYSIRKTVNLISDLLN